MKTSSIVRGLLLALLALLAVQAAHQQGRQKDKDKDKDEDEDNDYEVYQTIETMRKLTGHETFYDLLGVASTATPEEIGKAFHRASIKYHPDKKGEAMLPMFKLVQYAATLLRDQKRRARYEWLLHEAPAWHRESVYAIRRFVKTSKVSLRQFWVLAFLFSLGGQFLTHWLAYLVHAGRVAWARKSLRELGDKEVKRIRKKLESGDAGFLAQTNSDCETVKLADSQLPPLPSPLDLYVFAVPLWLAAKAVGTPRNRAKPE